MQIDFPFWLGDKIYKICPFCSSNHKDNCEHCAWRGCHPYGCEVGVRIYEDGSFTQKDLQITEHIVGKHNFFTVLNWWNIMYFSSKADAEAALSEYKAIRSVADRRRRYKKYKSWEAQRKWLLPNEEASLQRAKDAITAYCLREFGNDPDLSDISCIGLAYTDYEEDYGISVQVIADLIDLNVETYYNDVIVECIRFDDVDDITSFIEGTSFDVLVELDEQHLQKYNQQNTKGI